MTERQKRRKSKRKFTRNRENRRRVGSKKHKSGGEGNDFISECVRLYYI